VVDRRGTLLGEHAIGTRSIAPDRYEWVRVPFTATADLPLRFQVVYGGTGALFIDQLSTSDDASDGVGERCDNCPRTLNPDQADRDGDGLGDACDPCADDPNGGSADRDNDGWGDACDNCRSLPNPDQRDRDGNGIGDACEPEATTDPPTFRRGDCNDDGTVDLTDAVTTLSLLFLGNADPPCDDACDSNDDGALDISDAVTTVGALFLGNGAIAIPLPGPTECGADPTEDEVPCEASGRCP
jgi:hypothetical protein